MNRFYLLFIILFPSLLFAQEGNNLVFWGRSGLNFNSEPPSFFNTASNPWEISTAYSDKKGNLMFYVNENKFYNNLNQIIDGCDSLICGASLSARSTSFLLTDLQDSDNIILFSVWRKIKTAITSPFSILNEKDSGLYINIINSKTNNGRGKLVVENKLVYKGFLDQLTIVHHTNHKDYWIICKSDTNTFASFLYDEHGIHAPVFSYLPKMYTKIAQDCRMKANNKGDLLVLTNYYWEDIENNTKTKFYNYYHLFNFNQSSGLVTFAKKIDEFFQTTPYSRNDPDSIPYLRAECSFSPNDSLLYINTLVEKFNQSIKKPPLFQYQVYSNNTPGTRIQINSGNFVSTFLDKMQLAPNGKIYVGCFFNSYLSCIENPNAIGDACNFNMRYIPLSNGSCSSIISNVFYEYKKVSFIIQKENCKTLRFTKDCDSSFVFFKWYFGDGDSASGISIEHTYTTKGKFTVKLKATTLYGYSVWNSQEIVTTDIPQIDFSTNNSVGCQYVAVKFNDLTTTDTAAGTVTYLWDFGDGTTQVVSVNASNYKAGIGSINHVYNQSGKYKVKLTFNNGFCENSIEKTNIIDILPAPKPGITASIKSGCAPVVIRFTDTLSFNIVSKEYDFGSGVLVSVKPNQPLDTTITFSKEGDYFIHQKLTGTTGCITEDAITIKLLPGINQKIKPEIYNASYINDSTVEVTWKPVLHATSYQLKTNNDKIVLNSYQTSYQIKDKSPDRPNLFQLSATDTCGNISLLSEITQTIYLSSEFVNNEYILIRWTPYEYWQNGVLQYDLERKIGNRTDWGKIITTTSSYQFNDELINLDTVTSCELCYRIVASENGNNLKESRSNKVCNYLKPTVFIPNAFSPNSDGLNDFFKPVGMGIDSYEMYIYDRWGGLIFEGKSNSNGWDGKLINGSLAPEGVYVYSIQALNKTETRFSKVINIKGTVMLNR